MPLSIGEHLGPYEVLALIGAGGMGEVYRARDTKLDRDVAVKVLPAAVARDPERLARFEREAKVLAALNHPNIAAIYGLQETGDNSRAIVMELVEGPTLAERIQAGPLELKDALRIALAIADGLEAAHEKGIVHRDLKPANVKAPPDATVKVLDLGLATALPGADRDDGSNATNSPTLTMGATEAGMILGTAAYMSPEQASGRRVDRRADIWSFGVVLWEMLTGKRMFDGGETISHTLADVLRAEIDFGKLPKATPAPIRELLKRCLDRDIKARLRDIGEARITIQKWLSSPTMEAQATGVSRGFPSIYQWTLTTVVVALIAALGSLALVHFREKPPVAEVMRFQIPAPEKTDFGNSPPALSPDGRKLALLLIGANGRRQIWIRSLDTLEARPLPITDDSAGFMFWSPDSRSIGFTVPPPGLKLKRIDVAGGPAQTLCDITDPALGAWNREGVIVFRYRTGLMRVSEAGGSCSPLTMLDNKRGEQRHTAPSFLPDGKHFLYLRVAGKAEDSGVYIGSLDAKPDQQSTQRLLAGTSPAVYAPSPDSATGYLLFLREGSLMTQPFDPRKLAFTGDAQPIAEQIGILPGTDAGYFAVSENGALAYRTGGSAGNLQLAWYDRSGKPLGLLTAEPGGYNTVALSPEGTRVAFSRSDSQGNNIDIWIQELATGRSTRFTTDPARDWMPVWSRDASQIIYGSQRDGSDNLYQKAANGTGSEMALLKSSDNKFPQDWSPDGRFLLYGSADPRNNLDVLVLPLQGEGKSKPLVATQFRESQPRFSPDGRFFAYTSDATGRLEVYVRPFSPDGSASGEWPVSRDGGSQPVWRQDGKELFFISADSKMMVVPVTTTPGFKAGIPEALFRAPIWGGGNTNNVHRWDTLDGKRFLIDSVVTETGTTPITLVLNWQAGLKK